MCRLLACTATDLNTDFKAAIFDRAMLLHSAEGQEDGTGITDGRSICKKAIPYRSFGLNWLDQLDVSKVWLGHVRYASYGTGLTTKEAHPFRFDSFIGAHNGTMSSPAMFETGRKKDPKSDSYLSLAHLNKLICDNNGRIEVSTVEDWLSTYYDESSFVYMLLRSNVLLVIRGKTRPIYHMALGNGYLLATSWHMLDALKLWLEKFFAMETEDPVIIPENTFSVYQSGQSHMFCPLNYTLIPTPKKQKKGKNNDTETCTC